MNILVSNDDGIDAKGIKCIAERLRKDNHKVIVVAPDSNRSAVSNHLSMYNFHKLIQKDKDSYSHTGYPADCVFTAITSDFFPKFDVVIGGINAGGNMGSDIIYSGTCAIARQGVLLGVPSIALSIEPLYRGQNKEEYIYEGLADFTAKNLKTLISLSNTEYPQCFVNINALSKKEFSEVRFADKICHRKYHDKVKIEKISEKEYTSTFVLGADDDSSVSDDSDLDICKKGYITISRINACYESAESIDGIKFSL